MNVNDIYICVVCKKTALGYNKDGTVVGEGFPVKVSLVIKNNNDLYPYTDIKTKEDYSYGVLGIPVGKLYIDNNYPLVPYKKFIAVEKENISKRKVLKKFNKYESQIKEKE